MTALRRVTVKTWGPLGLVLALGLAAPAISQSNDAPVDVTAAPPPSAETIGPAQLRDFTLEGRVTRPATGPAATPAQPANTVSAQPRSGQAVSSEAAESPTPISRATADTAVERAGARSEVAIDEQPVTPSLPLEVRTGTAAQPGFASDTGVGSSPIDGQDDTHAWPWVAALLALLGGGGFIAFSRRRQRYADPGRLAFAGLVPEGIGTGRFPPPRPAPDPVPRPRQQSAPAPAPRPDPVPPHKPVRAPDDSGLIVSTRLKPQLNVEFFPDRVAVSEQDVMLQFEIVISNVGSAPARDVLVEGRLFTAHVGQDQEIAAFFQNPATEGDRMASIAPLGRISLKSVARLPIDEVHKFEAGGRKMFVPMIGFNILYRFGAANGQASASFLVGRGNEQDEKLAPFRIDLGPRLFRGLSSRAHSIGLQAA